MRKKRKEYKVRSDIKRIYKKRIVKKPKVARTRNANTMTEMEFYNKLRSVLRRAFRWWKPMMIALEAASRPSQSPNKRLKKEYQCNQCKEWKKRVDVEIDHILPCGSLKCDEDIIPFINNLTQESSSSYQVLCKKCHKEKTLKEKEERKNK